MNQVFSVVLSGRGFNFRIGFYFFQISSMSKYGVVGSNGSVVSFCGLGLRCPLCPFNLVMWFGNKKELSWIQHWVHLRWFSVVNLQVSLGIMVLGGFSGDDFWNVWESWIRSSTHNVTNNWFFLTIILIGCVKPNWLGNGLVLVALNVKGVAQKQYEQMLAILVLMATVAIFLNKIQYKNSTERISREDSKSNYYNLHCLGYVDIFELQGIRFFMTWACLNRFPRLISRSWLSRMRQNSGVSRGPLLLNHSYNNNGYRNVALRQGVMELYRGFVCVECVTIALVWWLWNVGIFRSLGDIKPESSSSHEQYKNIFL